MTVRELIEKLKEQPQDARATVVDDAVIWPVLDVTYEENRNRVVIR